MREAPISRALTSAAAKRLLFNLSGLDFNAAPSHAGFYNAYKSVEPNGNNQRPQKWRRYWGTQ
jgi:hypothetical protein